MSTPIDDVHAAITLLKSAPARGRINSNSQATLEHVAALMRTREPMIAWLEAEAERLALTPLATDLSGEHAVIVARAALTPVAGRPGPGQPGPVIDNAEAELAALLRADPEEDGQ
ncbi:hypothetical protein ACFUEN_29160 [Streptomyces griseorubiginosus]|uniref:hypothetical protein n=1 Tax=Streptomyces griseorubiginosus TaxID=67304 RepID=UPI00362900AE